MNKKSYQKQTQETKLKNTVRHDYINPVILVLQFILYVLALMLSESVIKLAKCMFNQSPVASQTLPPSYSAPLLP